MKLFNLNLDMRPPRRYFFKNPNLSERFHILQREIRRLQPDFITFQEATDILLLANLRAMYFSPYRYIAKGLFRLQGGLVTACDSTKWQLAYKKFYAFSDQGKFFSREIADRLLKKGIMLTIFDHIKTGERIVLINVHLTANYGRKKSDKEREVLKLQLAQINALLQKKRHMGHFCLITGDFNADFSSLTMQNWIKESRLKTVFSQEPTICPSVNPLCHPDQKLDCQIDNILLRKSDYCAKNCQGELLFNKKESFISDHFGLYSNIAS